MDSNDTPPQRTARQESLQRLMWLDHIEVGGLMASAPEPGGTGPFSSNAQSKALADTIVSAFTGRLLAEAEKNGGHLTSADIKRLAGELDARRGQLEAMFRQSFEQYVHARERAVFDHARQYPFDRLIVNSFADLFLPARAEDDGINAVTRRVLAGFFLAMDLMIGGEAVEEFQIRARAIVERLSAGDEAEFNWQKLYDDADAGDLCLDALVAFAPYFEDYFKRRDWFVPLVNGNLDSTDDWELTDMGFGNLVGALFSPLHAALGGDARAGLEKRHGAKTLSALERILDALADVGIVWI
ncbi:MAG: hypothetical protein HQ503_05550 [Rhodospirillales bacterium]|nr:hypothetical protein [Rhodospirillales bacterium]